MDIIVQKYGGSSVASIEKTKLISQDIINRKIECPNIVVRCSV